MRARAWVGILLTLFPLIASADWVPIGVDAKSTVYLDQDLLGQRTLFHPKIWILSDLRDTGRINAKAYRSSKEFIEVDCVNRRYQILKFILYPNAMGQGSAIDISKAPGFWFSVESSEFITEVSRRVCAS